MSSGGRKPGGDATDWLDSVRFDADGLVTVVARDVVSGRVLMVAWMNREALTLTRSEGRAVYWSRSRGRLWRKGEQSGHVQRVREIRLDCDGDTILLGVEQVGGVACHTGREHCFYRRLDDDGRWAVTDAVRIEPRVMYGQQGAPDPADGPPPAASGGNGSAPGSSRGAGS